MSTELPEPTSCPCCGSEDIVVTHPRGVSYKLKCRECGYVEIQYPVEH